MEGVGRIAGRDLTIWVARLLVRDVGPSARVPRLVPRNIRKRRHSEDGLYGKRIAGCHICG
jgi:hypothetical protein